ncbi:MAG: flagellar motor protein MotB [Desulfobacterales bacterium]|nr:flagellar motor protein MotB [Desulfobacterales bacterium]
MKSGRKKTRSGRGAGPPEGGWEIIYTGFVLILLSFFIMLCSFSSMDEAKITPFVKSFSLAMNVMTGGVKTDPGEVVIIEPADMVDLEDDLAKVFEDVNELVEKMGLRKQIHVLLSDRGLVIKLSNAAVFDVGKADIRAKGSPMLDKIASIIGPLPHVIRIEGHTDNVPIRTQKFPSNWELSTARAVSVLRYFMDAHHIPAKRLVAVGFGEFQPRRSNDTPEGRSVNRRVEIIVTDEKTAPTGEGES